MNKKIVALALGAAITTGIGGFGTFAYFTDTQVVKDNISITMGTLKGEANWGAGEWMSYNTATEAVQTQALDGLIVSNVKPGDKFYRDMVVKNAGTLNADMTLNLGEFSNEGLEVTYVVNRDGKWSDERFDATNRFETLAVEPGTEMIVRVEVSIPETTENELQGKNLINADAHEFITVGMHQTIEQ